MKRNKVLYMFILFVTILLLSRLIPYSKKSASTVNYAPDGFKETISAKINGIVTETKQEGLYWVTINQKKMPFSYDLINVPDDSIKSYPNDFIIVGDSVFKNANSDTFFLFRKNRKWQYFLPK